MDPNSYIADTNVCYTSFSDWYDTMWFLVYGLYAVSIIVWLFFGIYGLILIRRLARSSDSMAKTMDAISKSLKQYFQNSSQMKPPS